LSAVACIAGSRLLKVIIPDFAVDQKRNPNSLRNRISEQGRKSLSTFINKNSSAAKSGLILLIEV